MKMKPLAAACLLLGGTAAHAVTIFGDTFEADVALLNQFTFVGGWTVTDGSVDVVQDFFFPGKIVDLDGSTGNAGVFSKTLSLTGGVTYTASFDLAGSQRGSAEDVTVLFGTTSSTFSLPSSETFGTRSLTFTPDASGQFVLSFANTGGDNVGILLDNVVVVDAATAPIPEPGTFWLTLAGLVVAGTVVRSRRQQR